ncbi:MAG: ribosome biogenesis GTP-binding protein YihA/YsxC [Gammaproteobacteria bacterium]
MPAPEEHHPFREATFMLSVARLSQCPPDEGREVAFAGRSNAGKSSALNALCSRTKLARTSNTPGRTQQLNFFAVDATHRLVDLPGYGFAKVAKELRAEWGALVENYLERRLSLAGVILLMDSRHPLKPQDRMLIDWVSTMKRPLCVLLTKADKLSRSEGARTLAAVRRELDGTPDTRVQLFSAMSGQGVEEARAVLCEWLGLEPRS